MRRFRIGSAFGIPIQLDLTFLLVLPLFAYIIGAQIGVWVDLLNATWGAAFDPATFAEGALPWLLGVVAALGLFAGVVLHELGHSLVAKRFGFPIESITLWLFGGIAQLTEMPEDWRQELYIAVAGPAVSIALGVLSYVGFALLPSGGSLAVEATRFTLGYLAVMNVALAAFNLLPGFPMDGGRVLRALLARRRPYARATQIAAEVGKAFAIVLGLFGLLATFNPFLIAIAFFIYIGAASEAQQTVMRAAFEGVVVGDIMTPADRVETVSEDTSVADLIDTMFRQRHTGYPVVRNGEVVGLVTLEDARAVKEVERDAYTVADVMTTEIEAVAPDTDVMDALTRMEEHDIGRLVVQDDEAFAGLLTRSDVMTALSIIKESGRYEGRAGRQDSAERPATEPRP
ncbi:site-2 protease family protein [Halobacteriales archaeon Cl-PHB]